MRQPSIRTRRRLRYGSAALLVSFLTPLSSTDPVAVAAVVPTVQLTQAPADHQLYPRDPATGTATVRIAGQVQGQPTAMRLDVSEDGQPLSSTTVPVSGTGFSFSPVIQAGLTSYSFSLYSVADTTVLQDTWSDVVAGDVYLVSGQSNATARQRYDLTPANSSAPDQSGWVRTFGSSTGDPTASGQDSTWQQAQGDGYQASGTVGQYALRMGKRIVDAYGIPVALLQGGQEGMPISFFQPTSGNHTDPTSNYGRLLDRATRAGVQAQVRGLLWYQGESDNDNVSAQVGGFNSLVTAWHADYPGLQHIYAHQIRNGCLAPSGAEQPSYEEREAQRGYGAIPGVTVLSTTGVDRQGSDNCHYYYADGYQALADHDFATVAHDLYGGSAVASTPPNPLNAWFSSPDHTQITVALRNTTDHLTMPCGPAGDFIVNGSSATVTSVAVQPGQLSLRLSGPATGATGISYVGHDGVGPWITNDNGTGLLAFYNLPFAADQPTAFPTPAPTCPPPSTALTVAGDFNGDGKADIAGIDANGDMRLYTGNGDGTLNTASGALMWPAGGLWKGFKAITAGDFTGNGKIDIAGIDANNDLRLYTGDGQGHLSGGTLMWPAGGLWSGFKAIVAGDFNGDGKVDIAGIDANNDLRLYAGNGDGTLNTASGSLMWPGGGMWSGFKAITAGDFNGDGRVDIAGIDANNDLRLYAGNGDGTLNTASGSLMWPGGGLWKGFHSINAGDFNGDGKVDIAGIDPYDDMRLYAGNGGGTMTTSPAAVSTSTGALMWPAGGLWAGF